MEPSFTFTELGSYTVSLLAYNECACVDFTSMLLKVLAAESPGLDCIGTVCEGESLTYTAQQTCGVCNWTVSNGCDEVRQVISVIPERGLESDLFYVPNAFSPNEDGGNEVIQVLPAPDVQLVDFKFHIFDRWGRQLFHSTTVDQSRNGVLAGQ